MRPMVICCHGIPGNLAVPNNLDIISAGLLGVNIHELVANNCTKTDRYAMKEMSINKKF